MKSIHFIFPFVQNAGGRTLEISLNTIIPFNYILMLMDNGILLIAVFQVFHLAPEEGQRQRRIW